MKDFFKHTYYNTYYYSNIVDNILDQEIIPAFVSDYFAIDEIAFALAEPFNKKSVFHSFIEHIIGETFYNDMHDYDKKDYEYCQIHSHAKFTPYAQLALDHHGLNIHLYEKTSLHSYEDVEEYHSILYETGILSELYERIANEVFYTMFNNREALLRFNYLVAQQISNIAFYDLDNRELSELQMVFKKNGVLKRLRIPEWCKKAVFFRDRGRCCFCNKDLSGKLSITNKKHFDHIIPLAQGGLNDIVNIQLLCSDCNLNKSHLDIKTSNFYEKWY